jgi:hypothetical protein
MAKKTAVARPTISRGACTVSLMNIEKIGATVEYAAVELKPMRHGVR